MLPHQRQAELFDHLLLLPPLRSTNAPTSASQQLPPGRDLRHHHQQHELLHGPDVTTLRALESAYEIANKVMDLLGLSDGTESAGGDGDTLLQKQ
jgi:hypothetical protein